MKGSGSTPFALARSIPNSMPRWRSATRATYWQYHSNRTRGQARGDRRRRDVVAVRYGLLRRRRYSRRRRRQVGAASRPRGGRPRIRTSWCAPTWPRQARADRAKYFAGLVLFEGSIRRGSDREAEFRVVTTQSPVQHGSFSNSTPADLYFEGSQTVALERESIEPRQFKIGACSVAKKPPKIP